MAAMISTSSFAGARVAPAKPVAAVRRRADRSIGVTSIDSRDRIESNPPRPPPLLGNTRADDASRSGFGRAATRASRASPRECLASPRRTPPTRGVSRDAPRRRGGSPRRGVDREPIVRAGAVLLAPTRALVSSPRRARSALTYRLSPFPSSLASQRRAAAVCKVRRSRRARSIPRGRLRRDRIDPTRVTSIPLPCFFLPRNVETESHQSPSSSRFRPGHRLRREQDRETRRRDRGLHRARHLRRRRRARGVLRRAALRGRSLRQGRARAQKRKPLRRHGNRGPESAHGRGQRLGARGQGRVQVRGAGARREEGAGGRGREEEQQEVGRRRVVLGRVPYTGALAAVVAIGALAAAAASRGPKEASGGSSSSGGAKSASKSDAAGNAKDAQQWIDAWKGSDADLSTPEGRAADAQAWIDNWKKSK
eukprot:30198-Pelagococcus_subviridis.AAC.1